MALGDSDVQSGLFFQDGVLVVMPDGTKAMANLDWPESVDYLGQQLTPGIVVGKPKITYATSALKLVSDMVVMVDGTRYQVCHVRRLDDGKICEAELNKFTNRSLLSFLVLEDGSGMLALEDGSGNLLLEA